MVLYKVPIYAVSAVIVMIVLGAITYLMYSLYHYKLQAINAGLEDDRIQKEYSDKNIIYGKILDILSGAVTGLIFCAFAVSLYAQKNGNYFPIKNMGTFQVVGSGSMAHKNEKNTYLTEHNLDDQFNTFDIILVNPVSSKEDLQLYDVVVYEKNGQLISHRITDISEKDGKTAYTLRGDSNPYDDAPVHFEQIIGKYSGFKIQMLGIFVLFLQSALGYVTMGLVFLIELIAPVFERKIEKAEKQRLQAINSAAIIKTE